MIVKKTKFKNLLIIKQKNNQDSRGNLRETFNNRFLKKKFIFEYCTTSKKNVLRGFHFQFKNKQSKYVNVVKGKILDVVIDLRKNSKTFLKWDKVILSAKSGNSIYIPGGCAHGFLTLESNSKLYYLIDKEYNKKNNIGFIYNDKNIGINWPNKKFIISKKDKELKEFKV